MADPRLETAGVSAGSDPSNASVLQRLSNVERRLAALERAPRIQTGSGPPTQPARDGTPYQDVTNSRWYVRSAGAWKSVVLT